MNKRAFLFTVMTLLLLSSLFSLTGYYLTRTKSMQEIKTGVVGDKLRYITSDIAKSYFDILGIELNTTERVAGITTVKFNQMYTLPDTEDYDSKLLSYETFLEGTYSGLINTGITITGFTSQFEIMPFKTSFVLQGDDLYVYTVDSAAIDNIFVQLKLSLSGTFISGAPAGDLGGPNVHVIIKLADETIALDETRPLAINEVNPSFYVDIAGQRLDVYFGDIGQLGTLRIAPTLLSATIEQLDIGYSTTENTYITVGSIIIDPGVYRATKDSTIIIAEG